MVNYVDTRTRHYFF
jgi:hypothetical protein